MTAGPSSGAEGPPASAGALAGEDVRELGLVDALVRLSHAVQHEFGDASRSLELTPQQGQLLCVLAPGPLGLTDLGQVLHLERSSLTGLVDRVERRGLLTRHRDGPDRRACRVALTGTGLDLAHEVHAEVSRRLERLAGGLAPRRRAQLREIAVELLEQGRGR